MLKYFILLGAVTIGIGWWIAQQQRQRHPQPPIVPPSPPNPVDPAIRAKMKAVFVAHYADRPRPHPHRNNSSDDRQDDNAYTDWDTTWASSSSHNDCSNSSDSSYSDSCGTDF